MQFGHLFRAANEHQAPRFASAILAGLLAASSLTGQVIISEFRVRGPNGANDEFIEMVNNSGADLTVTASSGTGFGVAASDGTTRCSIPNGTVIPAGGHYLCVNSVGYSLSSYPAGNGTTATGDATYTTDIPDNAGIAVFNNNTGGGSYVLANRLDAVGSTGEGNTLYKEGTGYPNLTPFSIDYSFYRDNCGKQGSIPTFGACPSGGSLVDTNNNATNFIFIDTNGTSAGAGQRLGAPGPENLSSPISGSSTIASLRLDSTVNIFSPPNFVRDFTSDPPNNSTFGTISIRRRFVNNTGGSLTRLRFRIIDQTTFPAPSGIADLRSRTSSLVVVAGINDPATCAATGAPATPPCTVSVQGTTLEQPPSSPNGTAFNGSMSAGTITLGTPLANGASINLQFLLGIQQTGSFKLGLLVEALPEGGALFEISGCTDGCPVVSSVAPDSGAAAGGTAITITGTGFVAGATVTIGGAAASGVNVTGATTADATTPALSPGTLNDVTLVNPSALSGTLTAGWFADFTDVPQADIFHGDVEKLVRNGVTGGCGGGNYCRNNPVTRAQMAVFLLKSNLGAAYTPPACTGLVFSDVPCAGGAFDPWIEDLAGRGITGGCGGGAYCPGNAVTRAQMAVFLLKTKLGSAYNPPNCTGTVFLDVPCTGGIFDPWIEDLSGRSITAGCGGGNYCPGAPNTRGQMAVFLVKTFNLP